MYARPRLRVLLSELKAIMLLPDNNHIVKYFSIVESIEGYLLVSMELCICSVLQITHQALYFTPVELMLAITNAVKFLHGQNIIHGNLKPSNILIIKNDTGQYIVKLADPGCCSYFYQNVLGTPISGEILEPVLWQAPEILVFIDTDCLNNAPIVVSHSSIQAIIGGFN